MALPVFKSFFWVSIERFAVLCIQFVGTIVLARLIGPDEFGLIGILTVFIAIANMLTDSGMGGSLVREQSVSPSDYHTLFIYNGAIGLLSYLILYISAPYIASFYDIHQLSPVLRVLGLSVIFTSLSITQSIHLLRTLQFKVMSVCAAVSSLLATSTAIVLACLGMGVWALVSQTVGYSIFYSLSLFVVVRYIPRFIFDKQSFRKQLSYGISILGANIINTVQSNISTAIVGKMFSLSSTGFYTQATKLQGLPNNIIVSIIDKAAFPIITKSGAINEKVEMAERVGRYIYLLSFPLWFFCLVMAEPLIKLILGETWLDSAWIFSLLCFAGPFYTVKAILRSIFKATGDTKTIFKVDAISSVIGIVFMVAAGFISLNCLVYSVIMTALFSMAYYMIEVKRCYHHSLIEQIKGVVLAAVPPAISAVLMNAAVSSIPFLTQGVAGLFVSLLVFVSFCCVMYLCFRNKEFMSLCSKLLRKKSL